MITIIHGDDIAKMEKQLIHIIEQGVPKTEFDLKKNTPQEIIDALGTDSLFSEKKIITIHNLKALHHAKRKGLFEKLKAYKGDGHTHVILIQNTALDNKIITQIPTDNMHSFMLPKYFFEFLDGLLPKNAHNVSRTLAMLQPSSGEQLFFAAMSRVRLLLLCKTQDPMQFEEIKKAAPFYRTKLQSQAKSWHEGELASFYKDLFEIEVGIKTSNLPLDVTKHLDITVIKHLQ